MIWSIIKMNPRDNNSSSKCLNTFLGVNRIKSGKQSHNFTSEHPSFRKLSSANIDSFPPSQNDDSNDQPRVCFDMCQKHSKITDMYCVDCKAKICLDCALFDDHKDHKIENKPNFVNSSAQVSSLKNKIYKMQKNLTNASQSFRERLDNIKSKHRNSIIISYTELSKELERSKSKALLQVNDYFETISEAFKTLKNKVNHRISEIADLLCKPIDSEFKPEKLKRELSNLKSVISSESFARPMSLSNLQLNFNQETQKHVHEFCLLNIDPSFRASKIAGNFEEDNLFQSFSSLAVDIRESLEIARSPKNDHPELIFGSDFEYDKKEETQNHPFDIANSFEDDKKSQKSNSQKAKSKPRTNLHSGIGTLLNSYNDKGVNLYQSKNEDTIIRSAPQKEMKTSLTMKTFSKSPARKEDFLEREPTNVKMRDSKSPINQGLRRISTLQSIDIMKSQTKKPRIMAEDFQSHNTISANRQAGKEKAIQVLSSAAASRSLVVDLSNFGLDDQFFTTHGLLIRSLKSMRHLIINNNTIRDTGFKQILQNVIDLKVEVLSISGNLLENRSVEFLVDFSKHNSFLKTLSMKKNRFDTKSDTLKARVDYLQKKGISILI
jgi:hypothetical protein